MIQILWGPSSPRADVQFTCAVLPVVVRRSKATFSPPEKKGSPPRSLSRTGF